MAPPPPWGRLQRQRPAGAKRIGRKGFGKALDRQPTTKAQEARQDAHQGL
jgi:hypothetical protein